MGKEDLATCCAVFSLIGIIHLVLFGRMFSDGAVSFAIPAVERNWEASAKAKSCYNAAIIYAVFFALSVLARVYFRRNEVVTQMLRHSAHVEEVERLLAGPSREAAAAAAAGSTGANTTQSARVPH